MDTMTLPDTIQDEHILRIAGGDRRAFEEVYELSRSIVYGYALSLLRVREDAEDVMHDTYLKLFGSAVSYQPMGKPLAWILRIVRNLSLSLLRQRARASEQTQRGDATSPTEDSPALSAAAMKKRPESEAVEDRVVLDAALAALDDKERQIVILHATSEMKHREIAQLLDMPLSTVLSCYRRALIKMKEHLTKKGVSS